MQTQNSLSGNIIRLPDVIRKTGLKRSSIYARVKVGEFPKPISLGGNSVGWIEYEVDDWISERINQSRNPK